MQQVTDIIWLNLIIRSNQIRSVTFEIDVQVFLSFPVVLDGGEGERQILNVNVYLQVGEGIGRLHHLQCSIPVPTFNKTVRCFEFSWYVFASCT